MSFDIKTSAGLVSENEYRIHIFAELSAFAKNYSGTNQLAIYEAAQHMLKGQYTPPEADLSQESGCGGNCTCQ
jgi:hypothetical protein